MLNHPAFSNEQEHGRTITGLIESIYYVNDAIAVMKVSLGRENVKAVLAYHSAPEAEAPQIGEIWTFTGQDETHEKYGEQLIISESFRQHPSGILLIKYIHYHIPGLGITKARRLWSVFGEKLYHVLDEGDVDALIDKKLGSLPLDIANLAVEKWRNNKIETETVRFFQQAKLSTSLAIKALKFYGEDTIPKIQDNPYRLLVFTSFQVIDKRARECFQISMHDSRRMNAAVSAAVYKAYDAGHTAITEKDLIQSVKLFSELSKQEVQQAINQAVADQAVVISGENHYQGRGQASMEKFIARKVVRLLCNTATKQPAYFNQKRSTDLLTEFEKLNNLALNKQQREAVKTALAHRFALIQGTKGVGKATCLLALRHQINSNNGITVQVALSVHIAKRITEATLIETIAIESFFLKVSEEPLPDHVKLVVAEATMIDVPTMVKLLRVLPDTGSMVLVGDSRQLPPVGPGLIFHTLSCIPNIIPTVTLTQLHYSGIPSAAQSIALEQKPVVAPFDKTLSIDEQIGLYHIPANPHDISRTAVGLRHFIRNWGMVQIIAPTISLCDDINVQLHNSYRSDDEGNIKPLVRCTKSIGLDDMILCTSKLHNKGLSNGSLGQITQVFESAVAKKSPDGEVELCYAIAEFAGQKVSLSASDFANIKLGYCIPCNKAQGLEFERVIIALPNSTLLDNSWIYTAITRAQKQAIIIGDIQTFYDHCCAPPKVFNRYIALPILLEESLNGKVN
jgi:exodeoxyribonuclease V alpha subunit